MASPYRQISKAEWQRKGGLRNSALFRRMLNGEWTYWLILDAIENWS